MMIFFQAGDAAPTLLSGRRKKRSFRCSCNFSLSVFLLLWVTKGTKDHKVQRFFISMWPLCPLVAGYEGPQVHEGVLFLCGRGARFVAFVSSSLSDSAKKNPDGFVSHRDLE